MAFLLGHEENGHSKFFANCVTVLGNKPRRAAASEMLEPTIMPPPPPPHFRAPKSLGQVASQVFLITQVVSLIKV